MNLVQQDMVQLYPTSIFDVFVTSIYNHKLWMLVSKHINYTNLGMIGQKEILDDTNNIWINQKVTHYSSDYILLQNEYVCLLCAK